MPITLRDLAERRGEANFTYYGQDVRVLFHVEHITKEFRAESLRLMREGTRIQRRDESLSERVKAVSAPDDSDEAKAEDAEAEKAIAQIQAGEQSLKRQIDGIIARVVAEWDLLGEDDKMLPLTVEALFRVPADFERAVLEAIIESTNQGEAKGQQSTKPLPFISKQKEKQAL